jgi:hypothetical protein
LIRIVIKFFIFSSNQIQIVCIRFKLFFYNNHAHKYLKTVYMNLNNYYSDYIKDITAFHMKNYFYINEKIYLNRNVQKKDFVL